MKKVILIVLSIFLLTGCENKIEEETIEVIEDSKPTLVLNGEEKITLNYNEKYVEPGFIAKNKENMEVNDLVEVSGSVINKPGDYKITYTLKTDEEEITKNRMVTVKEVPVSKNASFVPVLMYHYFYDDENGEVGIDGNYLAKTDFIKQLNYLKENNYYFPTMVELQKYIDGEISLPEKSIILTMDDGQESNYRIAYPLAVEYQIPIVWFVVTSWTDPNLPYQQQILNSGYVTMESHTHDMHKAGCSGMGHGGYFQCVDKTEGINDLKTSKELLKNATTLAYPFGDYNDSTKEMLKSAGFSLAFTTEWGVVRPGMDKLALPRIRISAGNSLQTFIDSIS